MQNRSIELLAPAGSYETFLAVIQAGADAVYLGGSSFGARAYAQNFDEPRLLDAIDRAHLRGRNVYLAVNTLLKERELEEQFFAYLTPYYRQGLDAVIVQDLGVFSLIRSEFPDLPIHISTQMNVTGVCGAAYLKELGAARIVTARELSFEEIKRIHDEVDIEIESFIHGALCYCYSGQCLLSSMIGGRSGNRGRCAQPCRLPYEALACGGKKISTAGGFVLSPKDLNTIEVIPKLLECGIDSFKIEGRMKQAEYAAGVVSVYRRKIDWCLEMAEREMGRGNTKEEAFAAVWEQYRVSKEENKLLFDLGNRSGFTNGYYKRQNGKEMITFERPDHSGTNEFLQKEMRQRFLETESKEKINGILTLKKDFPVTIELSYGKHRVVCHGDPVQKALKQPLSKERVRDSLCRTGNTPFEFSNLQLQMEDDVFLPMQSLHNLRRTALLKLSEEALGGFRRNVPEKMGGTCYGNVPEGTIRTQPEGTREHFAVSVESRAQLAPVLSFDFVNDVYLDCGCYGKNTLIADLTADLEKIHAAGKCAYFILPAVFRTRTADDYREKFKTLLDCGLDGVVAKCMDAAAFVKFFDKETCRKTSLILDFAVSGWSLRAKRQLSDFSPLRDTVPLELNKGELFARNNENSELLLYGNLPLMISAQCIHANTVRCDGRPELLYLKDRYGKCFPVKNQCGECYNVIYNSTPLVLFGFHNDFTRMGISDFRISFTTEKEQQIQRVMQGCVDIFITGRKRMQDVFANGSFTNGHYKRGVE